MATSWLVGSGPECDLRVAEPRVSGRHCRLTADGLGGYVLEDLGSTNGTFVNGVRIAGPVAVRRGDAVTLGAATPMPWPPDDAVAAVAWVWVGREPDNDFVVADPHVSGYHARVGREPATGRCFVEDLGSANGTAVGVPGRRAGRIPLAPGDTIYLGATAVAALPILTQLDPGLVPTLPIPPGEAVIGRLPGADVVVDRPTVSGRHARVVRQGDSARVEDLGSANGTFLNGRRLAGPAAARPGDVIGLGDATFRLEFATATRREPVAPGRAPGADTAGPDGRRRPVVLAGLMAQGPLVGLVLTAVGSGGSPGALASAWMGLSVATVAIGAACGAVAGWLAPGRRSAATLSVAVLAAAEAAVAWAIVARSTGVGLPGAALALVALGALAGVALGSLIVWGTGGRWPTTGVALAAVVAASWFLVGGPGTLPRVAPWARPAADLAPSRWVFEGLLLLGADAARGEGVARTLRTLADDCFPADSARMGPPADLWAVGLMAAGLAAAAAYLSAAPARPVAAPGVAPGAAAG